MFDAPFAYDSPLFRPPSEGASAIFQATLGCSFNGCTFCGMYKTKSFKIRPFETLRQEVSDYALQAPETQKVFIADGDALILPITYWRKLLAHLKESFPHLKRVTSYATPQNILKKSPEQLREICEAGLSMLYVGIESGDPETIEFVNKGVSREQMVQAAAKAQAAGFKLSCTGLLGIAGKANSLQHAQATASLFNEIQPQFIGMLIWIPVPGADLLERASADFQMIDAQDSLGELHELVSHLEVHDTQFRSNHASNYLPLKGHLPEDKPELVKILRFAMQHPEAAMLRPEWMRAT